MTSSTTRLKSGEQQALAKKQEADKDGDGDSETGSVIQDNEPEELDDGDWEGWGEDSANGDKEGDNDGGPLFDQLLEATKEQSV